MKDEKPSIASIVDPMLKSGKPRAEILAAIAKARPDFKCPSAGIGNRVRALADAGKPGATPKPAKAGAPVVRRATDGGKLSAGDIAEPMLLKGTHTRIEIMAEVARLRPDFKDPSAAVSNRFRLLVQQGKNPGLKEGVRPVRDGAALVAASRGASIKRRLEQWDEYVKRNKEEVSNYMARLRKMDAEHAKQPRLRRVWP